jgi:hypothetical protein
LIKSLEVISASAASLTSCVVWVRRAAKIFSAATVAWAVALVALVAFVVRGVVVNMGDGTVDGIALVAVVAVLPVFASD